jgi:hypothetical protein
MDIKRIQAFFVWLGGAIMAAYLAKMMLEGQRILPGLLIASFVGIALASVLNHRYWLLIPAVMLLSVDLIPVAYTRLELQEVGVLFVFVVFVLRTSILKQRTSFLSKQNALILFFFAWVLVVWFFNPTGFMLLGSRTIGARFYLKLLLALLAFVVLSNQPVRDVDAKHIIRIIIACSIISALWGVLQFDRSYYLADNYYTWHQLVSEPALWLGMWLFAKYKIQRVISFPPWLMLAYTSFLAVGFYSGKRAALGVLLLVPVIQVFVDRSGGRRLVIWGAMLVLMLTVLVGGHGRLFSLPLVVQRAIANLPGQWDRDVIIATQDVFRKNLRMLAIDRIKENPLIGMGGFAIDFDEAYALLLISRDQGQQAVAFTRSWHTTWLGMAADFGVPLALIWALLSAQMLLVTHRLYRSGKLSPNQHTFVCMFYIYLITSLLRSWTSGHSALTPFGLLWLYALVLGVKKQVDTSSPAEMGAPVNGKSWPEPTKPYARPSHL